MSADEWHAFRALCKAQYRFDPEQDGAVSAAKLLGKQQDRWDAVWRRFAEAPGNYPNIPDLLDKAAPRQLAMFDHPAAWPRANETAEDELRQALAGLKDLPAAEASQRVAQLETEHGPRRAWVWARLGRSPLAHALEHLAALATSVQHGLGEGSVGGVTARYVEAGWKVDLSVIDTLACVAVARDVEAVKHAVTALYRDWLEAAAVALQRAIARDGVPPAGEERPDVPNGTCLLFTDGLRLDLGHRLTEMIGARGVRFEIGSRFAALPTITATAKPAISPVAFRFANGDELAPKVNGSGATVNVEVLRTVLAGAGFQVLKGEELGDPGGKAWAEYGDLDRCGHTFGGGLAHHAENELKALSNRVLALLDHGWQRVTILTDHGWLLLPGGLPKADLPEHLTVVRKGRCARLTDMAHTDQQTVPWRWDEQVRIAVAPGIRCYEAGKEYEHGGISPQECVVPVIAVTQAVSRPRLAIESISWTGMRCRVTLSGTAPGASVDIRTAPANASTSVIQSPKPAETAELSLLVPDDERLGTAAMVVAVSQAGEVIAQAPTLVGQILGR
ncbi:MAG: BREX-1 system phosphatase PglZ type B [Chloroflexota bacterium]